MARRTIIEVVYNNRRPIRTTIRLKSSKIPMERLVSLRTAISRLNNRIVEATPRGRTRRMARSIRRRGTLLRKGVTIIIPVRYARYVELGTRHIRARYFMRRQVRRFIDGLDKEIFDVRTKGL